MKRISVLLILLFLVSVSLAQSKKKNNPSSKTLKNPIVYKDENGQIITELEFFERYERENPESYEQIRKNKRIVELRLRKNPRENTMLPDFKATALDGQIIDTKALRGKVLVINFWFIACKGCIEEFPSLNKLQTKYKDNPDVVFLGLTFDLPDLTKTFLKKKSFNYQIIASAQNIFDEVFKYDGFYPVNIIVGKDGTIVRWQGGVYVPEKFDLLIQKELEK